MPIAPIPYHEEYVNTRIKEARCREYFLRCLEEHASWFTKELANLAAECQADTDTRLEQSDLEHLPPGLFSSVTITKKLTAADVLIYADPTAVHYKRVKRWAEGLESHGHNLKMGAEWFVSAVHEAVTRPERFLDTGRWFGHSIQPKPQRLPEVARYLPHLQAIYEMQDRADEEARQSDSKAVNGWDPNVLREAIPGYQTPEERDPSHGLDEELVAEDANGRPYQVGFPPQPMYDPTSNRPWAEYMRSLEAWKLQVDNVWKQRLDLATKMPVERGFRYLVLYRFMGMKPDDIGMPDDIKHDRVMEAIKEAENCLLPLDQWRNPGKGGRPVKPLHPQERTCKVQVTTGPDGLPSTMNGHEIRQIASPDDTGCYHGWIGNDPVRLYRDDSGWRRALSQFENGNGSRIHRPRK